MHARLAFLMLGLLCSPVSVSGQDREQWEEMNSKRRQARETESAALQDAGAAIRGAVVANPFTVTSIKFVREVDGTISAVGEVRNDTATTLTFGYVEIDFYAGNTFLGSDDTYIFAPQAVRLSASGIHTEALPAGAIGFFKIYTFINFNAVTQYAIGSEADTFGFVPVLGQVAVQNTTLTANSIGGTNVSGTVRNASTQALTYFTQIALAGYSGGSIADVTFTFASGISVPCGSITSTSGVAPAGTASFSKSFLHPVTSLGRAYVVWDEFSISPGSSSIPATGGSGSLQVRANCGWTATSNVSWITIVAGASGSSDAVVTYAVAPNTQSTVRIGTITVKGISFQVTQAAAAPSGGGAAPFGTVDTPLNNATGVTGSIAVTGWALDDLGVSAIRILRDPVQGETAGVRVFVGNAVLVNGARPDVAAAYASYPNNTRAGWGYLMLTNMLPNQGNGTFTFHMYADDTNGNTTLLGSRTITCANAAATTPFGAIDTPAQGQIVSGSVNNFGWVLSPGLRRADPAGGGTVNVVIDGALVGSPSGWSSRSDIAALFPVAQYSGVHFALGVLTFNSALLANGVHTIAWVVNDSQGGGAGVGSRYFTVANGAGVTANHARLEPARAFGAIASSSIRGRRGFDFARPFRDFHPDPSGVVVVDAEELDRIELQVEARSGRLRTSTGDTELPAGSRIDPRTGAFTWQPGVAFIGAYDLVFDTVAGVRHVRVRLHPGQSGRVGPQIVIDAPSTNTQVSSSFVIAGWAVDLDSADDSGIITVHVWAYPVGGGRPIFLGVAEHGGLRPDVEALLGERFAKSGYGLQVNGLPAGSYDIAVFAYSSVAAGFLPARTVRVTVR